MQAISASVVVPKRIPLAELKLAQYRLHRREISGK